MEEETKQSEDRIKGDIEAGERQESGRRPYQELSYTL
jgi:hypothetical protein